MFTGPNIITDGLVLALDAANTKSYPGTGTNWNDLSGNGNNGTLINGPTFDSGNNGSIVFDGVNDYVHQYYNLVGFTDFTISIWAKNLSTRSETTTVFSALGGYTSGGSYLRWDLRSTQNTSPGYVLFWAAGPNTFSSANFPNNFDINGWHFYVFTRTTSFQKIYIDSILSSEITFENNEPLTIPYNAIGRYAGVYWNGLISSYQIYNKSLTTYEIFQNYNAARHRFGL
jgi:hypothetical protein